MPVSLEAGGAYRVGRTRRLRFLLLSTESTVKGKKVKEVDLYSAFIVVLHTQGAQLRITHCVTCKLQRICLYLVSIHQMAHPQTEVADI